MHVHEMRWKRPLRSEVTLPGIAHWSEFVMFYFIYSTWITYICMLSANCNNNKLLHYILFLCVRHCVNFIHRGMITAIWDLDSEQYLVIQMCRCLNIYSVNAFRRWRFGTLLVTEWTCTFRYAVICINTPFSPI